MKKIILFLCFTSLLQAQDFNKTKLDSLLIILGENNRFMGSFSIFHNGKEVYQKSIGYAEVSLKIPADSQTKYRIGSITKTYTATVLMQFVEKGKLKLTDTLSRYFPEVANANKITIKDMLLHRSGIFNVTETANFEKWASKPHSRDELLAELQKNKPAFEPGESAGYSNTNYILLSYILEDLAKKPYSELLTEGIIKPLALIRTEFGHNIQPKKNEAMPYYRKNNMWKKVESITAMQNPMGAGSVVSTPTEVNKFYSGLFSGKLISERSLQKMTDMSSGTGFGLSSGAFNGRTGFGHSGRIDTFESFACYLPQDKVAMTILTNGTGISYFYVLQSLVSIYFGDQYKLPQFKPVKPFLKLSHEELQAFPGTYSDADSNMKIKVSAEGNKLMAQATNQDAFEVHAMEENIFKSFEEMATLHFDIQKNEVKLEQLGQPPVILSKEE